MRSQCKIKNVVYEAEQVFGHNSNNSFTIAGMAVLSAQFLSSKFSHKALISLSYRGRRFPKVPHSGTESETMIGK